MRVLPPNNETVRDLAKIFIKFPACDSHKDYSIKNIERVRWGSGIQNFPIFMKNREIKTTLLNLIEQVYLEDNTKLEDSDIFFKRDPLNQCRWFSIVRYVFS